MPIRSLEEYRFRYGDREDGRRRRRATATPRSATCSGSHGERARARAAARRRASEPGVDYYEAEVTIDELAGLVFEDLGLPQPEAEESARSSKTETVRFTDIRKTGPFANLDKRRTIRENLKRNALQGSPRFGGISSDDLRFKTWERAVRRESNAVVLAMMDVSGSMGTFEKYVSRAFYFWMVRFLRTKYDQVEIVFIAHHTEAKEVTEEEFFTRGESGGTKASSAYQLRARDRRRALPARRLEHLSVPLLRWRQLAVGQRGLPEARR